MTPETGYTCFENTLLHGPLDANPQALRVYLHLLARARRTPTYVSVKTGVGQTEVRLEPGELIYGRNRFAQDLNISPSTARNCIKKLERWGLIKVRPDSHFSIISVLNPICSSDAAPKVGQALDRHRTGTGHKPNENKKMVFNDDSEELRLATLLFDHLHQRDDKLKRPNLQTWAVHIDRLIRIDNREPEEIECVIRWCQADSFWQSNIRSTDKLRRQFATLVDKMHSNTNGGAPPPKRKVIDSDGDFIQQFTDDRTPAGS
jgi:hypothetical protein